MIAPSHSRATRFRRGQEGITLVETLVALAISAIILGPVGAWMVLTFTAQAPASAGFTDSGQSRLLDTYLTRDVASAEILVADAPAPSPPATLDECVGTGVPSATVVLNLFQLGTDPGLVVYGVGDSPVGNSSQSLYRWKCDYPAPNMSDYQVAGTTEVLRDVASVTAECDQADKCGRVTVEATLADTGYTTSVTASRRASAASLASIVEIPGAGGSVPVTVGAPTDRTSTDPYEVTLTAAPPDGAGGFSYEWSVSGPKAATLSPQTSQSTDFSSVNAGDFEVELVVSRGNRTWYQNVVVTVPNRDPVIDDATCEADLDSPGFYDCQSIIESDDSPSVSSTWSYPTAAGPAATPLEGPDARFRIDSSLVGTVVVASLTVNDSEGGSAVRYVTLDDVGSGEPGQLGEIDISPAPVVLPGQIPRLVSTGGPPSERTATFSPGPGTTGATTGWELEGPLGTESFAGTSLTHVFPLDSSGTHTVRRLTDSGPAESATFRVNAPPVANFTNSAPQGSAPATVSFADTTIDDYGVQSRSWNFNSLFPGGSSWTASGQTASWTFPNPGTYAVALVVTDIDGVASGTTRSITIGGVPGQPPPPSWVGGTVTFAPVPGATGYRVRLTYTGSNSSGSCVKTVDVNVGAAGPFEVNDAGNSCDDPSATTAAVAVKANSTTGPYSNEVQR